MTTPVRPGQERGSLSLFAASLVLSLFVAVGLVVDGGGYMRARQEADAIAAEAARAGAQMITADALAYGTPPVADAARAVAAARGYLGSAGAAGNVQIDGNTITATATTSYTPTFLGLIGVPPRSYTGEATVELVRDL